MLLGIWNYEFGIRRILFLSLPASDFDSGITNLELERGMGCGRWNLLQRAAGITNLEFAGRNGIWAPPTPERGLEFGSWNLDVPSLELIRARSICFVNCARSNGAQ